VAGEVGAEGLQGSRVELAQSAAELVDRALPVPHQSLVGTSEDLDRLDPIAVARHRPVVVGVGPDQIGEQLGIARVRFGPGDGVAVAVAADRQGIDGVNAVASCQEPMHQQPTVRLDADDDRVGILRVLGDEFVDPAQPFQPLWHARLAERASRFIEETHVVMSFRPVDAQEDQPPPSTPLATTNRRRSAAP